MPARQRGVFSDLSPDTLGGIKRKAQNPPTKQESRKSRDKTGSRDTTVPTTEATSMETTHHERHHHEEREVTHERGGKGTVWDPSGMIWSEAARKDLDRIKNTQGLSDEDRAKNIQRVVDRELEMSEHPFWRELLKDSYSGLKWSLKVTFVAGVVYYTFKAMAMAAVGAGAAQVSSSHMEGLQPAA